MATIHEAFPKLTHHYKPNYSHLDERDYDRPLRFKELGGKSYSVWQVARFEYRHTGSRNLGNLIRKCDLSQDGRTVHFVSVSNPDSFSVSEITHILCDYYSVGGCSHDHDCCGCQFNYVEVVKVSRRMYKVMMDWYRNY